MNAAAAHIKTIIDSDAALTALIPGGLFWELAPEGTEVPFATFRVEQTPAATKNYSGSYRVTFFIWDSTLTKSGVIHEAMKTSIENNDSATWRFIGATSSYREADAKEAFIESIFTFNLI